MSKGLRVGIVDDERLARERIRQLLENSSDVEIAFMCHEGASAVQAVLDDRPDLLFLDVQMPGKDGFAVAAALLDALGEEQMPIVVFVTAYEEHALRAFEARAMDYLVKPFDDERFISMLERVRTRVRQQKLEAAAGQLRHLLGAAGSATSTTEASETSAAPESPIGRLDRIVLRSGERVRIVKAESVDWIEAESVYARLHMGAESWLIRMPMHELESRLDPRRFARIHRSTIVNLDRVKELREQFRGDFIVVLNNGLELKLSRSRKAHLEELLGQSL
jgi:two-component system, LytTR family, response regulator